MPPQNLLSVQDALAQVIAGASRLGNETIPVAEGLGRTLAEPMAAKRTQPPFRSSAMDGYAVRGADAGTGARLKLIGEAAAGHLFAGSVGPGEAVRIFTGGAVPDGADTVLIQENTERDGDTVRVTQAAEPGRHIRAMGIDFKEDDVLLPAGTVLNPRMVALAAAAGHAKISVARRPRVAILATGDELVPPGTIAGPGQIVASNNLMVAGIVQAAGGEPHDLGIAKDTLDDIQRHIRKARDGEADVLVTIGGASVGDYDLAQKALTNEGVQMNFWRIAMRPGRPMMYGRFGKARAMGLPGNPASAFIGASLFLVPLLRALQGRSDVLHRIEPAVLGLPLEANDWRADHLRASLEWRGGELPVATPYGRQDSSMLRSLAEAECLIVRPANDPAMKAGDACRIIRLGANS